MKQKSKKAAAKRFRFTATGKVKFKRAGMRHLFGSKSPAHNLTKRGGAYLSDGDARHAYDCLPNGSR